MGTDKDWAEKAVEEIMQGAGFLTPCCYALGNELTGPPYWNGEKFRTRAVEIIKRHAREEAEKDPAAEYRGWVQRWMDAHNGAADNKRMEKDRMEYLRHKYPDKNFGVKVV